MSGPALNALYILIYFSQQFYEVGTVITYFPDKDAETQGS